MLGDGTVVVAQVIAHRTTDREVQGLIPAESWAFSLLFSIPQEVCPLSGPSLRCDPTDFPIQQNA